MQNRTIILSRYKIYVSVEQDRKSVHLNGFSKSPIRLSSGAGNRLCIANESKITDYVYVYSFESYNRRGLSARSL